MARTMLTMWTWRTVLEDEAIFDVAYRKYKMYTPQDFGKLRVARAPGGDGNQGGSFIAIPKTTQYPEESWRAIVYMTSPEASIRQMRRFYTCTAAAAPYWEKEGAFEQDPYFGGQVINKVFLEACGNVKIGHPHHLDRRVMEVFGAWLKKTAENGLNSEDGWKHALEEIKGLGVVDD